MTEKENFTPAPWFYGIPFRHKGSLSEWCNIYADNENNTIAEVLLHDGVNKNYYNAALISAAPAMYKLLNAILQGQRENYGNGCATHLMMIDFANEIEKLLKKARGEE